MMVGKKDDRKQPLRVDPRKKYFQKSAKSL